MAVGLGTTGEERGVESGLLTRYSNSHRYILAKNPDWEKKKKKQTENQTNILRCLPVSNTGIHLINENVTCPSPGEGVGEKAFAYLLVHMTATESLQEREVSDSNPFLQAHLIIH